MIQHRRLFAALGTALVTAAMLAAPSPAAAQSTCVKRDYTSTARSILFGSELATMQTHIEHCWDGFTVTVKKYAPTIVLSTDPLATITLASDPPDAWVDSLGRGRFITTATVTTGINVGGHAIGSTCTLTYYGLFYRNGDVTHIEMGSCSPFWASGARRTTFKGATNAVPFYYYDFRYVSIETLEDPLANQQGKIKITVDPGTPGCPGPDRCVLEDNIVIDGMPEGITDPSVRSGIYGAAQTVAN